MQYQWMHGSLRRAAFIMAALCVCLLAGCAEQGTPETNGTDKPAAHTSPEPLLAYAAGRTGGAAIDLSKAAVLEVSVNHCEYGEPTQTITDPAIIAAAADAVASIELTGGSDGKSSTGTHYVYDFKDAAGNRLCSFAFQDGMLMQADGRYPVTGLDALFAVEGVLLEDGWAAYWEAEDERRSAYEDAYSPTPPESAFKLSGYPANLLETLDPACIDYLTIRVSWNDEAGVLETRDPGVIQSVFEALSKIRAVRAVGEDEPAGQKWTVRLSFQPPENAADPANKTAYLSFEGDFLISDLGGTDTAYAVTGLEALFASADAEVLSYLNSSRTLPRPA